MTHALILQTHKPNITTMHQPRSRGLSGHFPHAALLLGILSVASSFAAPNAADELRDGLPADVRIKLAPELRALDLHFDRAPDSARVRIEQLATELSQARASLPSNGAELALPESVSEAKVKKALDNFLTEKLLTRLLVTSEPPEAESEWKPQMGGEWKILPKTGEYVGIGVNLVRTKAPGFKPKEDRVQTAQNPTLHHMALEKEVRP